MTKTTNAATDNSKKKITLFSLLREQIEKVERFVLQVNTYMHQEQERARLSRIIDRIEDYQAVEVPNDECAKVRICPLLILVLVSFLTLLT